MNVSEESLISSWVESFEADFEETPIDIRWVEKEMCYCHMITVYIYRVSHSEDGATVSLSWAEAACAADYQVSVVTVTS